MVALIVRIVGLHGVARKILGDAGVSTEKIPEVGSLLHVAAIHVFPAIVAVLLTHEAVRILRQLLAHTLVVLQVGLESRVACDELFVVCERRIAAELLRLFAVAVKEAIKTA